MQRKGATKHYELLWNFSNELLINTDMSPQGENKNQTPQLFNGNLCLKAFGLLQLRVSINLSSKMLSSLIHGLGKVLLPVIGPSFLQLFLHLVYNLDAVSYVGLGFFLNTLVHWWCEDKNSSCRLSWLNLEAGLCFVLFSKFPTKSGFDHGQRDLVSLHSILKTCQRKHLTVWVNGIYRLHKNIFFLQTFLRSLSYSEVNCLNNSKAIKCLLL